jgi:hypothetical protein
MSERWHRRQNDSDLPSTFYESASVGRLSCKVCGSAVRYGNYWDSHGWLCSTRNCQECNQVHIITDSSRFCSTCHERGVECLSYPQIFIREVK